MSDSSSYMTPEEINAYAVRRFGINDTADRSLAQLTYQRSMDRNQYGADQSKLNRMWDQSYNGMHGGFAKRNLFNSGVYKQAGTDYGINRSNALSDFTRQYTARQGGYDIQQGNIDASRTNSNNQIEAEKQASQAARAAQIRGAQGQ